MGLFAEVGFDDHEEVGFHWDAASGLKAISAIHWSGPGAAGGGVRFYPYADEKAAVRDVLRLSRAMSYKFVMAGLRLGGAKSVIIGDPRRDKRPALLQAFGRIVENYGGRYICGPDVGTDAEDMAVIRRETAHVRGLPGASGGTSPATGRGVFHGLRAAVRHRLGRESLAGVRVAVQGVGGVGYHLCRNLHSAGAELIVADVDPAAAERAAREFDAMIVPPSEILSADADVLAPCALGGVLSEQTIPGIKATVVCGGANNQLAADADGRRLHERGILFAPDYVVNAGGTIIATAEDRGIDEARLERALARIGETCSAVFESAERQAIPASEAADRMARERIGR